jgi:hypothetical protein
VVEARASAVAVRAARQLAGTRLTKSSNFPDFDRGMASTFVIVTLTGSRSTDRTRSVTASRSIVPTRSIAWAHGAAGQPNLPVLIGI